MGHLLPGQFFYCLPVAQFNSACTSLITLILLRAETYGNGTSDQVDSLPFATPFDPIYLRPLVCTHLITILLLLVYGTLSEERADIDFNLNAIQWISLMATTSIQKYILISNIHLIPLKAVN